MKTKDLNRLKVVLVEQKKTAKWLASELKKDPSTVSKWCTNSSQPSLETLSEIANILKAWEPHGILQNKEPHPESYCTFP